MHINKDQLRHLANLAKISIPADQEDKYLADISNIISFLDTLDADATSDYQSESKVALFEQTQKYADPKALLQNVKHPIQNESISIKTPLAH